MAAEFKNESLTALVVTGVTDHVFSSDVTFYYKIATIGTNVIIAIETSLDGTNWVRETPVTHTTNDTFKQRFTGSAALVRLIWVSTSVGSPVMSALRRSNRQDVI